MKRLTSSWVSRIGTLSKRRTGGVRAGFQLVLAFLLRLRMELALKHLLLLKMGRVGGLCLHEILGLASSFR